ncbi:uncharacterized protein LOC128883002 isoform X2 [Hylaeus volcanicus]|uniref:uncharacterized protein LOC128883002 isoform X2 n=1 Tax=Hylaeus volcanicus TaxID=313075 RepID=UPI0023B854C0|nr:uncharacterized protein LOC128883002 isoform X2 [Hylaeus volcanicus]
MNCVKGKRKNKIGNKTLGGKKKQDKQEDVRQSRKKNKNELNDGFNETEKEQSFLLTNNDMLEQMFQINKEMDLGRIPATLKKEIDSTDNSIPLTEEQKAFFDSPMVKHGIHPAYILGMRSLPPYVQKIVSEESSRTPSVDSIKMTAKKLFNPLFPDTNKDTLFEGRRDEQSYKLPTDFHEPCNSKKWTNSWPYVPRYTSPGYAFKGATFSHPNCENVSKRPQPWHLLNDIQSLASNTFLSCWTW